MLKGKIKIVSVAALAVALSGCLSWKGEKMELPDNAVLLDVRSEEEFASGHIKGAVLLPHDEIAMRITSVVLEKSTPVFVYCRSGRRSAIAIETMKTLGYTELVDLGGKEEAESRLEISR